MSNGGQVDEKRYRVAQWATGDVGRRAMREVIRHPTLDLVGVRVYDHAKDGVDAGELCGEAQTGIAATTDRAAVFGLKADYVLYMPRAAGPPNARIGLTIPEILDDVVTMLESGTTSPAGQRGARADSRRVRAGHLVAVCERKRPWTCRGYRVGPAFCAAPGAVRGDHRVRPPRPAALAEHGV